MANRAAPFRPNRQSPYSPYARGRQFGMNGQAPYGRTRRS